MISSKTIRKIRLGQTPLGVYLKSDPDDMPLRHIQLSRPMITITTLHYRER
jgi:hypothetical protein